MSRSKPPTPAQMTAIMAGVEAMVKAHPYGFGRVHTNDLDHRDIRVELPSPLGDISVLARVRYTSSYEVELTTSSGRVTEPNSYALAAACYASAAAIARLLAYAPQIREGQTGSPGAD